MNNINVTTAAQIESSKSSETDVISESNKDEQSIKDLSQRADGTLLVSSLLDTIAAPATELPAGTDINEEMVALLDDLYNKHEITKANFVESRRQFVAGLYHFAVSYRANEDKINALLKERGVKFNKGSNYWRKAALLWLNSEINKSVATRYGQIMEYAHMTGIDANALHEAIVDKGIKDTLSTLKARIKESKPKVELPDLKNEAVSYFKSQFKAFDLLNSDAQIDFTAHELAPGAASVEIEIDDQGNLRLKGIVQTSLESQIERLESSYKKSALKPISSKDIACLMTKLPDYVSHGIGFKNDGQNIKFVSCGDNNGCMPVFMMEGTADNSETLDWGYVAGAKIDDQIPSGLASKNKEHFKFNQVNSNTVNLEINGKAYEFECSKLLDTSILEIGSVKEQFTYQTTELMQKIDELVAKNTGANLDIEAVRVALWGNTTQKMNVVFNVNPFLETAKFIAKKSSKIVQCVIGDEGLMIKGYANGITYSLHVKMYKR
ncbi:hypothetical protein [Terasakiella pusilla]|uniref:hypothetical protein n=1 Tax=Terasakiella pusilla TaxID=64973 RepID=UPI003AA995C1